MRCSLFIVVVLKTMLHAIRNQGPVRSCSNRFYLTTNNTKKTIACEKVSSNIPELKFLSMKSKITDNGCKVYCAELFTKHFASNMSPCIISEV